MGKKRPLPLLLAVALVGGWLWWRLSTGGARVAPLANAAYFAAAGGLLRLAVPLMAAAATISPFPSLHVLPSDPTDPRMFMSESEPSGRILIVAVVVTAAFIGPLSWIQERDAKMFAERKDALERLAQSHRVRIAAEERTATAREVHDVVAIMSSQSSFERRVPRGLPTASRISPASRWSGLRRRRFDDGVSA